MSALDTVVQVGHTALPLEEPGALQLDLLGTQGRRKHGSPADGSERADVDDACGHATAVDA